MGIGFNGPERGDTRAGVRDTLRELVSANTEIEHQSWKQDLVTLGTNPESTRIAMARQFARSIGTLLAHNSSNQDDSRSLLLSALKVSPPQAIPKNLLYQAIETVTTSGGYDAATNSLFDVISNKLADYSIHDKINIISRLLLQTVQLTFDALLEPPKDPSSRRNESGDSSIFVDFTKEGQIDVVSITMLRGRLCAKFIESLAAIRVKTNEHSDSDGDTDTNPKFKVKVDYQAYSGKTVDHSDIFLVTRPQLVEAYFLALVHYAAIDYADRVRSNFSQ